MKTDTKVNLAYLGGTIAGSGIGAASAIAGGATAASMTSVVVPVMMAGPAGTLFTTGVTTTVMMSTIGAGATAGMMIGGPVAILALGGYGLYRWLKD